MVNLITIQFPRTEKRRILRTANCYFYQIGESKVDLKWRWPVVIIGMVGSKFSSLYYRCNKVETGLNDMRPGNRIFDILSCAGALSLHLPNTKSTSRYFVDFQTLVSQRDFCARFYVEIRRLGRIRIRDQIVVSSLSMTSSDRLRSLRWERAIP